MLIVTFLGRNLAHAHHPDQRLPDGAAVSRELAEAFRPAGPEPVAWHTPTILACTLWGEARGEKEEAVEAVAQVILNRAEHPRWWGKDVRSVCLKPWQFSCWNKLDPNRAKLAEPIKYGGWAPWEKCCHVAAMALAEPVLSGYLIHATHYFSLPLTEPPKAWGDSPMLLQKIGGLSFYSVESLA